MKTPRQCPLILPKTYPYAHLGPDVGAPRTRVWLPDPPKNFAVLLGSVVLAVVVPRFFNPEEAAVIREVYDNENAHDVFAEELERALDASAPVIVIEPHRLGDETARWIAVGNCLHKTAVITGIGAVASGNWLCYQYFFCIAGMQICYHLQGEPRPGSFKL